ncbi:nitrous oxide-stimulated promoter family protein [Clostridium magnum]|uniref:Nitrous oxide-stimulated promoter n=1 Tax=Clostridium magnum DSM 2767 TaxID=1121326 RepID=A0A162TJW9_9CLOT|nr:nitrous oxide-stimulated promoter family protein [Clostridium magnum]KZL92740.1 hypothetical protein CLMAG_25540 [Clostridium magnum DSM 2767]SHI24883.1 Nitrous oxide-stimulated promoter [Clostridium magnum DSM 2767]
MKKSRRVLEKEIFDKITIIYCKGNNHSVIPCSRCKEIMNYAHLRINSCTFGDDKKFCSKCTVHCFKPDMRENVKKIMRYSGPRIIFYHPIMAMKHLLSK